MDRSRLQAGIDEVSPIPEEKTEPGIRNAPHLNPNFEIRDWGFDTVGVAFEIDPAYADSLRILRSPNRLPADPLEAEFPFAICDLDGNPTRVTESEKGNWRLSLPFATVKGFPDTGVIYVEGRASALIARCGSARQLVEPGELDRVEAAALRIAWTVLGGKVFLSPKPARYRRWDLAVDMTNTGTRLEGVRVLEALSSVRLPYWCLPGINRVKRRTDLLSGARWPASGNLQFRIYDKGLEMSLPKHRVTDSAGRHAKHPDAKEPGHWLRFERQVRPTNPSHRLTTAELQSADLRKMWLGRLAGCLDPPSLTVCSPQVLRLRLSAIYASDKTKAATAKRLIAESTANAEGLESGLFGDDQKLANDLLKLGLTLAKNLPAWQSVELRELIHTASECWDGAG